jgi:hypothetical protein
MQMHRAKVIVRMVPAWGDRKVAGGAVGGAPPVKPMLVWAGSGLSSVLVRMLGLVQEVVVLVVGMEGL